MQRAASTTSSSVRASSWRRRATGQRIVTIEGIAPVGSPSDVQQAFVDAGAVQCGFCTPGLIMAVHDLLERSPDPGDTEIREELAGNVCRCTGYGRIIDAVQQVAVQRRSEIGRRRRREHHRTRRVSAGPRHGALGTSPSRPDGIAKVQGTFEFSSDISADGCLFGATLRSPHPYARIVSIDRRAAWKIAGVEAIITAEDVPGKMHLRAHLRTTNRSSPPTSCVTSANRSRPSPPTTPRRARRALDAIVVRLRGLDAAARPRAGDRRRRTSRSTRTAT